MHRFEATHNIFFYERPFDLYESLFRHISPALEETTPCVLILQADHRCDFRKRLEYGDVPVDIYLQSGVLHETDAEECLEAFTRGSALCEDLFQEQIIPLVKRDEVFPYVDRRHASRPPYAYGEMVNVLVSRGKPDEALELERMWNRLALKYSFALLCGYDWTGLVKDHGARFVRQACLEHHRTVTLDPR